MKHIFALLGLTGAILFTACGDDGSGNSADNQDWTYYQTEEQIEEQSVYRLSDSITGTGSASYVSLGGGFYFEETRTSRDLIDTMVYDIYIRKVSIDVNFEDTTVCNYSNTKILYDGAPLAGEVKTVDYYYTRFVAEDFMTSYDEPHTITIQYDSLNCGNLKETYVLIPSTEPGGALQPEDYYSTSGLTDYSWGKLFLKVGPGYYSADYTVWPDTVNSKCYLRTPIDSIQLNLTFQEVPAGERAYPSAIATTDSATLVNFLQEDTAAVVSCALIYQTWDIPAEVKNPTYYSRLVKFDKNYSQKQEIEDVYWNDSTLFIESGPSDTYVSFIWVKNLGDSTYYYVGKSMWNYGFTRFSVKSIYENLETTGNNDSLQIIAFFNEETYTTYEEYQLRKEQNDYRETGNNSAIAQLFNSLLDDDGTMKPEYYYIKAFRIPGYTEENEETEE